LLNVSLAGAAVLNAEVLARLGKLDMKPAQRDAVLV